MRRENVCPHTAVTGSTKSLPLMGHVSASRSASLGTSSARPPLVASGWSSEASTASTPEADRVADRVTRRIVVLSDDDDDDPCFF
jgi:hypothetical protein